MDDAHDREDLTGQAISWFLRLREGVSDAEWVDHVGWLEMDAAHGAALAQVEHAWIDADVLATQGVSHAASTVVALARRAPLPGRRHAMWLSGAIAAGIAAFAMLPHGMDQNFATEVYRTGNDAGRVVALADGSRLTLNRGTELAVRLGADARSADLKTGEVVFDIHHDAARPFTVTAGTREVRVLGTEFDVLHAKERFSVAVRRGLVAVSAPGDQASVARLPAGSTLVRDVGAPADVIGRQGADDAFSWTDGRLVYTDQPIARLAADLERYGGRPVTVDPALARTRVTATIEIGDGAKLGRQIELLLPVRLQPRGARLVLAPAP